MEPKEFDTIARHAVQASEQKATMDVAEADALWSQIGQETHKTYVAWWRAAAIILFLLCSSLVWYGKDSRVDYLDTLVKLNASEKEKHVAEQSLLHLSEAKPTNQEVKPVAEPLVETLVVRDTILQIKEVERIVYVETDTPVIPELNTDSLLAVIQAQEAALTQLEAYAQVDEPKTYLNNFNVVFEDENATKEKAVAQKEPALKFNLSLLKRK